MMKKLVDNISSYISNELNYNNEKREIISYGLQIILGITMKTFSILLLAYILNIFKTTIAVSISFIVFRRIIGGSHVDTYNKCYFLSVFLMLLLGGLGEIIKITPISISILAILIYVLTFVETILWIPAGTEKKMIKNIITRRKIKLQTIILLTVWVILCNYFNSLGLSKYAVSSSLGVILVFFLATPLGYRFTKLKLPKTNLN